MKLYTGAMVMAALAAPVFGQTGKALAFSDDSATQWELQADKALAASDKIIADSDKIAQAVQAFSSDKMQALTEKAQEMAERFKGFADADEDSLPEMDFDLSQLKMNFDSQNFKDLTAQAGELKSLALMQAGGNFFQAPQAPQAPMAPMAPVAPKGRTFSFGRADSEYDSGTRALDQHKYDEAVQHFDAVISGKSPRSDGALYWKAYALNRAGKRDEALGALAQLHRDYASSAWLNDAQALEAEVKQSAGQPVSPGQESNDDLKLLAINSLMNADADRAIPLVEGILKGNAAPNVKDRALFVLAQNKSPRAQQVLMDYAKGGGNPDMQMRAIQYVGMSGTKEAQQTLAGIYSTSGDARVKSSILQMLMMSRNYDALMNIAKTEKDASLRDSAIRDVASAKGASMDGLLDLYGTADVSAKHAIVDGLMAKHDAKSLVDLARKESDPAMKRFIVERLGSMRDSKEAMDYMMELIKQ